MACQPEYRKNTADLNRARRILSTMQVFDAGDGVTIHCILNGQKKTFRHQNKGSNMLIALRLDHRIYLYSIFIKRARCIHVRLVRYGRSC